LVAGIRKIGDFDISVAAYPEKHPQSPSWDVEIDNLKRKFDAGATRAITQMFFDNDDYFRFIDRVQSAGVTQPIVPGIQPIHSFKQISSFASKCGATIPNWLVARFDGLEDDPETHALVASAVAAEQVLELVDEGVTEFHFLTLNRSNLVLALARLLGVRPD
jgi:methylenetetrahydrofolate reductase (NADPH)